MRQDFDLFSQRQTKIVVIGTEKAEAFRNHWEQHNLPMIGIPDPSQTVLKMYGQEIKALKLGRMPAQMLIDRQGILRFVHYGQSMSDIPASEVLLKVLDRINAEG